MIFRIAIVSGALFLALLDHSKAHAGGVKCTSVAVVVQVEDRSDVELLCDAVRGAIKLLDELAIDTHQSVTLLVSENIPLLFDTPSYGFFDRNPNQIRLLSRASLSEFRQSLLPFGIQFTDEIYASVAAHEVAHAYISLNDREDDLTLAAQEYIAYVVQLSMLSNATREEILGRYEIEAFDHDSEITSVYLQMNPHAFGVKSWMHFSKPDHGIDFVESVMAGDAITYEWYTY